MKQFLRSTLLSHFHHFNCFRSCEVNLWCKRYRWQSRCCHLGFFRQCFWQTALNKLPMSTTPASILWYLQQLSIANKGIISFKKVMITWHLKRKISWHCSLSTHRSRTVQSHCTSLFSNCTIDQPTFMQSVMMTKSLVRKTRDSMKPCRQ